MPCYHHHWFSKIFVFGDIEVKILWSTLHKGYYLKDNYHNAEGRDEIRSSLRSFKRHATEIIGFVLNFEWLTVYFWGAGLSCCCLSGMDTGLTGVFAQGHFPLCSLCWLDDCAKTKGWLPRNINTLWDNSQKWWNTAGMFDNAFIDLTFSDGFIKCYILSSSCECWSSIQFPSSLGQDS